ncbi:MAG: hypothetical protein LQ340_007963 [Diploschistes diacapsis]|nr:MAG: hypothetical protein LQ340_007963 [Diploschistes diacapsis]
MADRTVIDYITRLQGSSDTQDTKLLGYEDLLKHIVFKSQPQHLAPNFAEFIDSILGETVGIVAARPLLSNCVRAIKQLSDPSIRIECGRYALQSLEPRVASFEDQDILLRQVLADAYQEQGEFIQAAKALQGICLDTSQRKFSEKEKINYWIRICRLYLEEDDTASAENYLNRVKTLLYKFQDQELNLSFQLCQARILDSRRKFLDSSQAYHAVSLSPAVADEERSMAMSKAIICAVLAPAGPQRSRTLSKFYKDERAAQLGEFAMLEKMFLDRLISPVEVQDFAKKLEPHQLAHTSDGSTVLAKAVIEHNLFGASKLYSNLSIDELGLLLNLDPEKAEQYAAQMLEQRRLVGSIDQIQGIIFFGDLGAANGTGQTGFSSMARTLETWNHRVQGLVEDVERVSSLLSA